MRKRHAFLHAGSTVAFNNYDIVSAIGWNRRIAGSQGPEAASALRAPTHQKDCQLTTRTAPETKPQGRWTPGGEQLAEADVRLDAIARLLAHGLAGSETFGLDELSEAALLLTRQARRFMDLAGVAK